jgi:hypothetical protein
MARSDSPRFARSTCASRDLRLRFVFSGQGRQVATGWTSTDRRLARIVLQCQDLPVTSCSSISMTAGRRQQPIGSADVKQLPERDHWTRVHGEGLPNVGRNRAGGQHVGSDGRERSSARANARSPTPSRWSAGRLGNTAVDLPEVLRPSRHSSGVPRIVAASELEGIVEPSRTRATRRSDEANRPCCGFSREA